MRRAVVRVGNSTSVRTRTSRTASSPSFQSKPNRVSVPPPAKWKKTNKTKRLTGVNATKNTAPATGQRQAAKPVTVIRAKASRRIFSPATEETTTSSDAAIKIDSTTGGKLQ